MNMFSKYTIWLIAVLLTGSLPEGANAEMTKNAFNLPKAVGAWSRPDSARIVEAGTIFDYMNGGGELYLAYGFDRLYVYEYTAKGRDAILAEVYVMNASDDAFGLLSLDWSGEPVRLASASSETGNPPAVAPPAVAPPAVAPPARALYGMGLLRLCADNIYARVMAHRETPESKQAVLSLGAAITADRKAPAEPGLLRILPRSIGSEWKLRHDRLGYFRSHLVLNSLYYLSHQNILDLGRSTEAVTAPYENKTNADLLKRVQFLGIRYADPKTARNALDSFHKAYLPEHRKKHETEADHSDFFTIEDGWLGYALEGACLTLVFESPDRETARKILERISCKAADKGDNYAD